LKDADLQSTTEKKLRKQLEEELKCDLTERKGLIREEVNTWLNENQDEEDGEEEAEQEEEEEEQPKKKRAAGGFTKAQAILSPALSAFLGGETKMARPQVVKKIWDYIKANNLQNPKDRRKIVCDDKLLTIFKPPVTMFTMNKQLSVHCKSEGGVSKRKRGSDSEEESEEESEGEDEESEEGSDDGEPKPKKAKKAAPKKAAAKAKATGGKGGGNAFTKPLQLSDALSEFFGGETGLNRPELTKRFWAYFKENGLQDPADKRMILCDDKLKELLGVDRFQAFGLAKYLKPHILS